MLWVEKVQMWTKDKCSPPTETAPPTPDQRDRDFPTTILTNQLSNAPQTTEVRPTWLSQYLNSTGSKAQNTHAASQAIPIHHGLYINTYAPPISLRPARRKIREQYPLAHVSPTNRTPHRLSELQSEIDMITAHLTHRQMCTRFHKCAHSTLHIRDTRTSPDHGRRGGRSRHRGRRR